MNPTEGYKVSRPWQRMPWKVEPNGDPYATRWRKFVARDRATGRVVAYGENYHSCDLSAYSVWQTGKEILP